MKKMLIKSLAALGLLAGASSAYSATITLTPVYLGYTTGNESTSVGPSAPTGLTTTAPDATAEGNANNRFWFAVNMTFDQGNDTTVPEDFRALLYNIKLPTDNGGTAGTALAAAISRSGTSPTFYSNISQLSGGEAVGTSAASGYSNVNPDEPIGANAFDNATGQGGTSYTLGYFAVKITDASDNNRTIALTESNGQNMSYYINNSDNSDNTNFVTTSTTFVGNSYTFPAVATPEPASLSLLAFGAVGLIRRRRQA